MNNDHYRREFWIWVGTHSAPLHHCCAFVPLWCPAKWCKQKNGRIRKGKANAEPEHTYTIHRITQCTDHKHEQLQSNRIHFKCLTKVHTSQKKTVAFLRGCGSFIAASPVMRWQKSAITSDENEQVNCILHKSNLYNLRRNINVIHCDAGNATHYFVIDFSVIIFNSMRTLQMRCIDGWTLTLSLFSFLSDDVEIFVRLV